MIERRQNEPTDYLDVLLRVGGFVLVGYVALVLASSAMARLDAEVRAALSVLLAGLGANLLISFKFERGLPSDFGMGWEPAAPRQFGSGVGIGIVAVAMAVGIAILAGFAHFEAGSADSSAIWLAVVLLVGALGEELLFRGYAFQYLLRAFGPAMVAVSAVLFGLVHLSNPNVQVFGVINTILWGGLLGYAYTRAGTLWLSLGVHFGWNIALALLTSNLSGITIRATAWDLQWSAGELWSGGGYGLEGGVLAAIVILPVFLLVRRVR